MTLFNLLSSLFSSRRDRGTGRGRNPNHTRLALEPLEDRQLLDATFLPETSNAAPAIITFQGNPYIAWTGTDSHLNIENPYTSAKVTLPDTSSAAPALAVYNGRLYIAWTGTDAGHHLNVESSADGFNFSNKFVLNYTTTYVDGPALAVYGGVLAIAWVGDGNLLHYAYSFDPANYWQPAGTIPYQSYFRPSLDEINGDFRISWTDFNYQYRSFSLTYRTLEDAPQVTSLDGPSEATDDGFPPAIYLGHAWTDPTSVVIVASDELGGEIFVGTSRYGPSLATDYLSDCHHFFVAWTDLRGYLAYSIVDPPPNPPNYAGNYSGAASQYGPALADLNGHLNVTRTGTDNLLNALDPVNGSRPSGGPVNATRQGAASPAADGELYLALAGMGDQTWVGDVKERAARNTSGFGHNGPSETTDDGFPGAAYLGFAWTDQNQVVEVGSDELGGENDVGVSRYGPSLATDYLPDCNHFYVTWTGLDGHLYYDVL